MFERAPFPLEHNPVDVVSAYATLRSHAARAAWLDDLYPVALRAALFNVMRALDKSA